MHHPFDLDLSDLEAIEIDFKEQLTDEEAAKVAGGILPGGCVTTQAVGEEGGHYEPPIVKPPRRKCGTKPPRPECDTFISFVVGEEGGYGLA